MKISSTLQKSISQKADLLVIGTFGKKIAKASLLETISKKSGGSIAKILKNEDFSGDTGQTKLINNTDSKIKANSILVVGLGEKKELNLESLRKSGESILKAAKSIQAKKVIIGEMDFKSKEIKTNDGIQAICEGILLSDYQFTKYKKGSKNPVKEILFTDLSASENKLAAKGISLAKTLTQGVCLARDLVNTPAAHMTPKDLATHARKISGIKTKVHNLAAIKKLKMGAYLSVAQGSTANPPYFIEMHYKPTKKAKKKIALIGKGVTFDTGGYSMKPPKSMENMKDDMAGAAAVIGLMSIISKLKPNVEVSAYVAATENMVDGHAQRPGDICTAMNGKTIEVLNTDAEGRLTLADAMCYANKKKPDYMIDLATLTGACLVALGDLYTGILGTDQGLIDKLKKSSDYTNEKIWQLPLAEEYKASLKSTIADLKNIGSPYGGTITAAIFLSHFVGDTKWAHMDIAGPSWASSNLPYTPRGGTGVMVKTLAHFLSTF